MRAARGVTLAETLVALALATAVLAAILTLWDSMRHVYREGDSLAEVQQATRIAFRQIERHVRLAGVDINPDRDRRRPVEAIEAAYRTAIAVRGNYDANDPDEAASPEADLSGGAFPWVPTGNDEIVTFALVHPETNAGSVRFEADVKDRPRDGAVEEVVIDGVALTHDDPPYTLYRFTLHKEPERWGSGRFVTKTPVMDNVSSLTFRYFAFDGATVAPVGGADDPPSVSERRRIFRVRIEVEGLVPDPRGPAGRRFAIEGEVVPRNPQAFGDRR